MIAAGDVFIIARHTRQTPVATSGLGSQSALSSVKPTQATIDNYHVPPASPKYIVIPAIGVNARVYGLPTDTHNQLQAPGNIYDAGWYNASSLPGQPGAMFVDGHVSSWTAHGIFYDLRRLAPGDVIKIVRGDGRTFTYAVQKTQVYDAAHVDMTQTLRPINSGKPGLNLMTCAGPLIRGTSEFSQRLVVYASLQS